MTDYLRVLQGKFEGPFSSEPFKPGFELDDFQKHAINAIKNNENVLVTAHTGSGKTVPAIFGIAHSLSKNKKIIYTSPIKSLSNQKLYELKQKFPDIGIMTGDIKFNPDAQCVIMTTEILRNILYQKQSQHIDISEIDKVIFDEVHYINDPDRGRVWEECIILMPKEITLIMLSATIDKAEEFASWIGNIKQKITNLIPTYKRVVPLEHFFYHPDWLNLKKIVTHDGNMINYDDIKKTYSIVHKSKLINKFIVYLKDHHLVPALFFVFSRKECEKLALSIQISLCTKEEIGEISKIFNYELRNHKLTYENSPQYHLVSKLVLKGVAFHHSGLIPILKEVIEILFEKGLIKVLFATETFAVGVNMPTKTVIFPRLTKYSNNGFRYLRTDEYLQMAGRAGRRGLDKFGTVIILPMDDLLDKITIKKMMTGKSPSINSKFKLSYQFLLKILLNEEHSLDKFLDKSLFSKDNKNQIDMYNLEKEELVNEKILMSKEDLEKLEEYHQRKFKAENMRGNARKKEFIKLDNLSKEIKDFEILNSKYEKHILKKDNIRKIEENIEYLRKFVSQDSTKMVQYLKDNEYIDKDTSKILVKGVMASGISECNEILLTEIIYSSFFQELKPEEIVGLLALFIDEKSNEVLSVNDLVVSDNMKTLINNIKYISKDFADYEYNSYIEIGTDWEIHLSFIELAYCWAKGDKMTDIYTKYGNIYEGTFIRNILRIKNIIDNIKSIAEMIEDQELLKKLENLDSILVRDQVTTESLYIMKS